MVTIPEIMRAIIGGISPHTEAGCIVSHLAWCMAYDGRM